MTSHWRCFPDGIPVTPRGSQCPRVQPTPTWSGHAPRVRPRRWLGGGSEVAGPPVCGGWSRGRRLPWGSLAGTGGRVSRASDPLPCREHCWGARSPWENHPHVGDSLFEQGPLWPCPSEDGRLAGGWHGQTSRAFRWAHHGPPEPPGAQEPGTQSLS